MQPLVAGSEVWAPVWGAWRRCRVLYAPGSSGPNHVIDLTTVIVSLNDVPDGWDYTTWPAEAAHVLSWPDLP